MASQNQIKVRLFLPEKTVSDLNALAERFEFTSNQCTAVAVLVAKHIIKAAELDKNFGLWRILHDLALESVEWTADIFKLSHRQQMAAAVVMARALDQVPKMSEADLFKTASDLETFLRSAEAPILRLVENRP